MQFKIDLIQFFTNALMLTNAPILEDYDAPTLIHIVYRQGPYGTVDPSFRALPGRLGFTVRRHNFKNILSARMKPDKI